jgi:DNA recombination protein RmuC
LNSFEIYGEKKIMVTQIIFLIIGIGIGAVIGYLAFNKKKDDSAQLISDEKIRAAEAISETLRRDIQSGKEELSQERNKSEARQNSLTRLQTENENLVSRLSDQKLQLEELETRFAKEFENLANRILEDKSKKFTEQNETQLKNILDPLRDRIKNFEERVNQTHNESAIERSALKEQLRIMSEMNKRMSEEALNLTKALKGDSKKQGNWGELILEKVLERSGLIKGREYDVQQSFTLEDGSRLQPDVIIRLPDSKNLIVDAKVSLVAYERYIACDDDDKAFQESCLKEHIASVRSHIKGLSGKSYHNLYGIGSPDFVLLFIPIEPAFLLSISMDNDLYNDAFDKNVVLVSPTTLLATLRTIANVWKQEYQSQNAQEIAKYSGLLYDKFVSFVDDLNKVGDRLRQAQDSYDDAKKKLHEGRGNLVKNAEYVKTLGAKTTKSLPKDLVDKAEE